MYLFRPLTFIFFILSTGSVYAENTIEVRYFYSELASNPIVQELIENVQPPDHLFHWAREHRSLRHNQDDRPWYLKLLKRRPTTPLRGDRLEMPDFNNAIFSSFTDNRAALYFWSHPATGMGMSSGENYTYIDSESGKTPSLVVAKPSSDATYSVYVSGAKGFVHDDSIIAAATDFVLHIRVNYTGEVLWQEWVLQNPDAIEWATSKKSIIKPIVDSYLTNFNPSRTPLYMFHSIKYKYLPSNYIEILSKSIKSRFSVSTSRTQCSKLLSN